ncbi:PEP-CTERM sorting domain-containing protein [Pontiellaceae bacterium B12219]|nr:PEP-CTERM sorting domain-containing protein [Pontiellaceae bacterium B12219]
MKKTGMIIGAVVMTVGAAQANLIVNGGFEDPAHTRNDGTNPDSWSVFETSVGTNPDRQVRTKNDKKHSGSMGVALGAGNSDHTGQLWQTVTTEVGQEYAFGIWAATFLNNANNTLENFKVELRDGTGTNGTVLATLNSGGLLTGTWQFFSNSVIATSTDLTIHISNISTTAVAKDGNDLILDDVSFVAIPEPATLGMIAAFGGGILFIRRRFMQ